MTTERRSHGQTPRTGVGYPQVEHAVVLVSGPLLKSKDRWADGSKDGPTTRIAWPDGKSSALRAEVSSTA